MNFETKLQEYARLIVRHGLNVQKGQTVTMSAPVDCALLARMCAECAYESGAQDVIINWQDDTISRLRYLHADDEVFDRVHPWLGPMFQDFLEKDAPRLALLGNDPEALKGTDPDRLRRAQKAAYEVTRPYFEAQVANRFPWSIAACPTPAWARHVFPDLPVDEAVAALWEHVFAAVRVTGDGQAVARWEEHTARTKAIIAKLNALSFVTLRYKNSLGTDLEVGLPEGHYWAGGADTASCNGQQFVANMPTEEVFTLPHRDRVNGKVYSSMPLVQSGNIIDGFWMEFQDGKIVALGAERGEEYLKKATTIDEGASFLGEVALVPYHSPIRDTGILFYETLFDENASCHFAFGEAYPCIHGAKELSREEQAGLGINQSLTHVDFMIGTADLSIVGITADGREVPVFADGNFAL